MKIQKTTLNFLIVVYEPKPPCPMFSTFLPPSVRFCVFDSFISTFISYVQT